MFQNSKCKYPPIRRFRVPVKTHKKQQSKKYKKQLANADNDGQSCQVNAEDSILEVVEVDGAIENKKHQRMRNEEQEDQFLDVVELGDEEIKYEKQKHELENGEQAGSFLKVVEVYDEILDLRDPSQATEAFQNISHAEISQRRESHKARNIKEEFNLKTNAIAQRIVTKQTELRKSKDTVPMKPINLSQIPLMLNRLVIERILETEAKLRDNNRQPSSMTNHQTRTNSKNIRFLSTKPKRAIYKIFQDLSTKSIQVSIADSYKTINNPIVDSKSVAVQVKPDCSTGTKNLQTRIYRMADMETNPISHNFPSKYTNTAIQYPSGDQECQSYEYMSSGELFCLDWVDKHLFDVHINPYNIILDEKIKDISEIATKSTLFSDWD